MTVGHRTDNPTVAPFKGNIHNIVHF